VEGVDYSTDRPDAFCMASSGLRFAARYFGAGSYDKHASAAECGALAAAGLNIVALCEGWEDDALRGAGKGVDHAQLAAQGVANAGGPDNAPIYFAVDFDASIGQLGQVAYYFEGVRSVIGQHRIGIYGGIRTIEWAAQYGVADWFFQTYAWSGGQWSQHNHFEQYLNHQWVCGGLVDRCRSMRKSFGQWQPGGSVEAPADDEPHPSTNDGDWDMTYHYTYVGDVTGYLAMVNNDLGKAIEGLT